jgi:hypothetical protein
MYIPETLDPATPQGIAIDLAECNGTTLGNPTRGYNEIIALDEKAAENQWGHVKDGLELPGHYPRAVSEPCGVSLCIIGNFA